MGWASAYIEKLRGGETVGFVVRDSPAYGRGPADRARVPDRRSPFYGVCVESTNAHEATAYGERGRPSVTHSGGVVRPAPNSH